LTGGIDDDILQGGTGNDLHDCAGQGNDTMTGRRMTVLPLSNVMQDL